MTGPVAFAAGHLTETAPAKKPSPHHDRLPPRGLRARNADRRTGRGHDRSDAAQLNVQNRHSPPKQDKDINKEKEKEKDIAIDKYKYKKYEEWKKAEKEREKAEKKALEKLKAGK